MLLGAKPNGHGFSFAKRKGGLVLFIADIFA